MKSRKMASSFALVLGFFVLTGESGCGESDSTRMERQNVERQDKQYQIAQPPPANDRYMDYKWWVRVPVGISSPPVLSKKFPSGYTILEYHLSPEEQKIPHDETIELGIHFR